MGRQGVVVFTRRLQYLNRSVTLPDGTRHTIRLGEEKGVDVRIALDTLRLAHRRSYDVAILFRQDQDLSEVAKEIRLVAREQDRWIKLACAFPLSAASRYRRGVDATDWIRIDRTLWRLSGPGQVGPWRTRRRRYFLTEITAPNRRKNGTRQRSIPM